MVTNLITCLESFKTKMEYKNVDFDGDRPVQYTALREDMAKLYSGVGVALFRASDSHTTQSSNSRYG